MHAPALHSAQQQQRPPGMKRLLVVCSVLAYVLCLGVPVWWHTTSLQRPTLPHDAMHRVAEETAHSSSVFLPLTLQVVVAVTPALDSSSSQEPQAATLQRSVSAAVQDLHPGVPLQVAVLLTAADGAGCSRAPPAAAGRGDCPDLSGAPPVSNNASNQQQQQLVDEWLLTATQQLLLSSGAAASDDQEAPGRYTLFVLPASARAEQGSTSSSSSSGTLVVGRHRHAWLQYHDSSSEQEVQAAAASAAAAVLACCFGRRAGEQGLAAASALPVSAGGRTHLSLSLLNAAPAPGDVWGWDMAPWEARVLAPLAAALAPVAVLSMESQVLFHTPARHAGHWSDAHAAYVVPEERLPFFIDSEWALEAGRAVPAQGAAAAAAARGSCPAEAAAAVEAPATPPLIEPHVLQFVVYVPPAAQRPLQLLGADGSMRHGNAFLIPAWGGLLVLTPDSTQAAAAPTPPAISELSQQQYAHITAVLVAQLQALFGVAPTADAAAAAGVAAVAQQHMPPGPGGFAAWQVDALVRQRSAHDVREAARVLAALSTLVQELPNLEMPELIGQQVAQALAAIERARRHITAGAYVAAAAEARAAHAAAEAAFSNPAVLTQLNFPESHKLGVYMPLFLPLAVPLLQGLVTQLRHVAHQRRQWASRGRDG